MFLFGSDNARSQQHRATFKRLTKVAFLGNGVLHLFLLFPFLVPYSPFYCRRKTKENPTRINHPFLLLQFWNYYLLKIIIYLKDHSHCSHQMVGIEIKMCLRFYYSENIIRCEYKDVCYDT